MKKLRPTFPRIFALHARVADYPLIAEYLKSDRRQKYSMGSKQPFTSHSKRN